MRERVPFYRAVYLVLLHPDAVLKPGAFASRPSRRGQGVRTLIGSPRLFLPSVLEKTRGSLCPLPSAVCRFFTNASAKTD